MNISRDRINTCVAKIPYQTRFEAELARVALIKKDKRKGKGSDKLHCYHCQHCGKYHLGRLRRVKHGSLSVPDWTLDWFSGDGIDYGDYDIEQSC